MTVYGRERVCVRERERERVKKDKERESHDYEKMRGVRKDKKG